MAPRSSTSAFSLGRRSPRLCLGLAWDDTPPRSLGFASWEVSPPESLGLPWGCLRRWRRKDSLRRRRRKDSSWMRLWRGLLPEEESFLSPLFPPPLLLLCFLLPLLLLCFLLPLLVLCFLLPFFPSVSSSPSFSSWTPPPPTLGGFRSSSYQLASCVCSSLHLPFCEDPSSGC